MGRERIEHEGTIVAINGQKLSVEIINRSMCDNCHAQKICLSTEENRKIIEVENDDKHTYNVGDTITIIGGSNTAIFAILIAYVIPIILLMTIIILLTKYGFNDNEIGLWAIGSLIPYYVILYLTKNTHKKQLNFKVKQ